MNGEAEWGSNRVQEGGQIEPGKGSSFGGGSTHQIRALSLAQSAFMGQHGQAPAIWLVHI